MANDFSKHWRLLLADGIALLVLAIVCFYLPLVSATQLSRGLSAVFLILGIIYFSQFLEFRHERGTLTKLLQTSLAFVIGSVLFEYSGSGMKGINLSLTFYFLLSSVLTWAFYSNARAHKGWNWGFVSSITSFALGLYLVVVSPFAPLWLPGSLMALDLLVAGSGMLGFALSVRKYHPGLTLHYEDMADHNPEYDLFHNKRFHT